MDITVIIPAAGSGTRLGLLTPKELYEIFPGVKLIDFSLMHIKKYIEKFPRAQIKIAVVIRKEKFSVYEYVKSNFPENDVVSVFFNDNYFEWAGSVYSAKDHFSDKNIVLLPDSLIAVRGNDFYHDKKGKTLIELLTDALDKSESAFGEVSCLDEENLSSLGALFVEDEKVFRFQDKPKNALKDYNAFWVSYAFKKYSARRLYEFLCRSIKHDKTDYEKESFYPAGAIEVHSYHDLGTWDNINNFRKRYKDNFF